MSSLIVKIVKINRIEKHPNADRLQIAYMEDNDWSVVVGLDQFKVGDLAIYVPVDSLLDEKLENHLFPADSKIKLSNHRVRAIKIRQYISVGMFVELTKELISLYPGLSKKKSGEDVASLLNIQKYEPPRNLPKNMQGRVVRKNHPDFKRYTDVEHLKNFSKMFDPEEEVYVSEKIHGSNTRLGLLETQATNIWQKVLKLFRLLPKYSFVLGSHNIQLNVNKKLYYDRNIYAIVTEQYKLKDVLKPGEVLYGETAGPEVQKGFSYGCKPGELKFFAFDVMKDGKYLDTADFLRFCTERNIPIAPTLCMCKFKDIDLNKLCTGESIVLDADNKPSQPVREGCVIRPAKERFDNRSGRVIFKVINPEYLLLKDTEDWH